MRMITVSQLNEPERFSALYQAMIIGVQIEGGYIKQLHRYYEAGELICKFVLREVEHAEMVGKS